MSAVVMDRIVLFGAGASYGAGHTVPKPTPLGKDLFPELAQYCPQSWGNLPQEIRAAFHAGFEQGMQVLWDKYSSNIALLMRHMTLYLAQFRPDGTGNDLYSDLIRALDEKGVAGQVLYSTLNYECLLELAASSLGMQVEYGEGQLGKQGLKIWKLHGSCNFLSAGIQAGSGVTFGSGVAFQGQLRPVNPNDAIQYCLSNTGLYPAMALYMNGKPVQIGRGVIDSLQQRWSVQVKEAKRILVVGVRPYPEDPHVWEPLGDSQGELGYVGPEDEFNHWRASYRPEKPAVWMGTRWDGCFEDSVDFLAEGK